MMTDEDFEDMIHKGKGVRELRFEIKLKDEYANRLEDVKNLMVQRAADMFDLGFQNSISVNPTLNTVSVIGIPVPEGFLSKRFGQA